MRDNAECAKVPPLEIPVLAVGAQRGAGQVAVAGTKAVAAHVIPVLFQETGHFIPEERPEPLVAVIERFIADQPVDPEWRPARAAP